MNFSDMAGTIDKFINRIIQGDSIEVLREIPDKSVDMIFADPPYNLQLEGELWRPNQTKVDAVDDEWDKFASFDEYDNFSKQWLQECWRILKDDGTIWVIGSYHNIFRLGKIIQDIGFWILNDVIWIKTNPMPNFKGTRFNNAHETLIWASKNKDSKYTFHYKSMRAFNDDLQLRSDWYIPICNGAERIKINGEKAHPTQKPEALLYRIIVSTSNPGDIILDPFFGSGTTGAISKKLGRKYIGIEKEDIYIKIANERIDKIKPYIYQTLLYPFEKKPPKAPFGNLIESGLIEPGDKLYSKDRKYQAEVLSDGTIKSGEIVGSIHSVSSQLLGKISNNGWMFWYIERNNNLKLIDDLRKEYINKYA